jgi:hypothetical protein
VYKLPDMDTGQSNVPTLAGTVGGTLLVLLHLDAREMLQTAVLAAVGAVVSYLVTVGLKWGLRIVKRKREK